MTACPACGLHTELRGGICLDCAEEQAHREAEDEVLEPTEEEDRTCGHCGGSGELHICPLFCDGSHISDTVESCGACLGTGTLD